MPVAMRGASLDVTGKRSEGNGAALLGRASRPAADAGGRIVLDDRVPFAAAVALARPARMDGAAILADELGTGFGHEGGLSGNEADERYLYRCR
jgi:hypothetical protein